VIDESSAVRETIAILLGNDYEVHTFSLDGYLASREQESARPSLVVAGGERAASLAGHLPKQVPVLWLRDPSAARGTEATLDDAESLPRRFSPHRLRQRVEQLLSSDPQDEARQTAGQRLCHPYLPADAERIIGQGLAHDLPISLIGEPGTGKRAIAQAIHSVRGVGPFVAIRGKMLGSRSLELETARPATLYLHRVEELNEEGQQLLLACMQSNGTVLAANGSLLRLICSAETDLAEAEDSGLFSSELYYRLTVLSARLLPLRERVNDIPALASLLAKEIGVWLGLTSVGLTAAAMERLSNYLWFGNLAELEAVLTRTLSIHRQRVIDAKDLLFESRAAAFRPVAPPARTPPPASLSISGVAHANGLAGETLDLVINELAHEFKNPMVTVKTFAQQLRSLVREGGDDAQMARLTGEAVDRMDSVLENLLQFSRFGEPCREPIPLSAVVNAALDELADAPDPGGRIEIEPLPPIPVYIDGAQAGYALVNLLQALTRTLQPQEAVSIRYREPASIEVSLPRPFDPPESSLGRMLDSASEAVFSLPLGISIAGALIERNGGLLVLSPDRKPTTAIVSFPVDQAKEANLAGNGKSERPSR
jgi:DNA-binding NtrC family response regulator